MLAWYIVSSILFVVWVIAFFIGNGAFIWNYFEYSMFEKNDYQIYAAIMAVSLVFVFFHWIVLLALVPIFGAYGLWQAIELLIKKPWKKTA